MNPDVRVLGSHVAKLGESPLWSGRDSTLYWVDVDGCSIQALSWASSEPATWALPGRPSCIAMTEHDSSFIVGMGAGIIEYNRDSGEWVELVALESDPLVRMNDGRTDPAGRLWIGSMDERADDEPDFPGGHLFRVERDGSAAAVMDRVGTSNGLAFAPDGSVMYWTDSWQQVVWAFDYDVDTGSAHNQRPLIDFSPLPGKPDGACMDADGCYWVACVYGWSVVRITPTGKLDRRVELPVHKPSMPAFAGPNLETLVVTSISSGGRHPAEEGSVPAGSLVAFEPGTLGLPEPVCRVRV